MVLQKMSPAGRRGDPSDDPRRVGTTSAGTGNTRHIRLTRGTFALGEARTWRPSGERVASATWWKRGQHTRRSNSMRVINRSEAKSLKNPAKRAPGPRPGLTSPPRRRGLFRATPRGLTPRATRQTLPHPPQPPIRPAPEPQGTTIDAIPYTSLVFPGKTPSSPRFPKNPPFPLPPPTFQKSQKSPD